LYKDEGVYTRCDLMDLEKEIMECAWEGSIHPEVSKRLMEKINGMIQGFNEACVRIEQGYPD